MKYTVLDMCHETESMGTLDIVAKGLLPLLGVASDALYATFGAPVPLVHLANVWHVATSYPIWPTTGPLPESKAGIAGGGTPTALDGTPAMRSVKKVLKVSRTRGKNQVC